MWAQWSCPPAYGAAIVAAESPLVFRGLSAVLAVQMSGSECSALAHMMTSTKGKTSAMALRRSASERGLYQRRIHWAMASR